MLFFILPFYWAWYYAQGLSEYIRYNNMSPPRENTWDSVVHEFEELKESIYKMELNAFSELFDVLHALFKHYLLIILPPKIYSQPYIWYLVFIPTFPTAIKLGIRYQKYGCIRNHSNSYNLNHMCKRN